VDETLEFLQGTFLEKHVKVEKHVTHTDEILADPNQLKQALLNVLVNGVDAMSRGGVLGVQTERHNGFVDLSVRDSGCGISKKDLGRVFDPFYSKKEGGTGLGLSVVHSIIRSHGGTVNIVSTEGQGTTVVMKLPVQGGRDDTSTHPHRG